MIKYYSRSLTDIAHLYKYDEESKEFYWMDHCWTGQGEWVLRDEPVPGIVEITEDTVFFCWSSMLIFLSAV